ESIQPGYSYRLRKQGADESNTPDSLTVFIDRDSLLLKRLEYLDINEERNVIIILRQSSSDTCDEGQLEPVFPDSVEKVKL
ncbi:MAG: hypothetical protein AB1744_12510, partial [Candidatus Zixiibacteriota bacterium]